MRVLAQDPLHYYVIFFIEIMSYLNNFEIIKYKNEFELNYDSLARFSK